MWCNNAKAQCFPSSTMFDPFVFVCGWAFMWVRIDISAPATAVCCILQASCRGGLTPSKVSRCIFNFFLQLVPGKLEHLWYRTTARGHLSFVYSFGPVVPVSLIILCLVSSFEPLPRRSASERFWWILWLSIFWDSTICPSDPWIPESHRENFAFWLWNVCQCQCFYWNKHQECCLKGNLRNGLRLHDFDLAWTSLFGFLFWLHCVIDHAFLSAQSLSIESGVETAHAISTFCK